MFDEGEGSCLSGGLGRRQGTGAEGMGGLAGHGLRRIHIGSTVVGRVHAVGVTWVLVGIGIVVVGTGTAHPSHREGIVTGRILADLLCYPFGRSLRVEGVGRQGRSACDIFGCIWIIVSLVVHGILIVILVGVMTAVHSLALIHVASEGMGDGLIVVVGLVGWWVGLVVPLGLFLVHVIHYLLQGLFLVLVRHLSF